MSQLSLICARNCRYVTAFGSLDNLTRSTRLPAVSSLRCPSWRYAQIRASVYCIFVYYLPMDAGNGKVVSGLSSLCWIVQVQRLAIKQLLCHMLRGVVLYDKQSIN